MYSVDMLSREASKRTIGALRSEMLEQANNLTIAELSRAARICPKLRSRLSSAHGSKNVGTIEDLKMLFWQNSGVGLELMLIRAPSILRRHALLHTPSTESA